MKFIEPKRYNVHVHIIITETLHENEQTFFLFHIPPLAFYSPCKLHETVSLEQLKRKK